MAYQCWKSVVYTNIRKTSSIIFNKPLLGNKQQTPATMFWNANIDNTA